MIGRLLFKLKHQIFPQYLVSRFVRKNFASYFKIAKKLGKIGTQQVNRVHWNNSDLHFFIAHTSAHAISKIKSVSLLVGNGYSADAMIILRSVFENILDTIYILRNPEKLNLYLKYSLYLDIRNIERNSDTKKLTKEQKKLYLDLQEQWMKNEHLFTNKSRHIRQTWRDYDMKLFAEELRLFGMYERIYQNAHDYVHGNSNMIQKRVFGRDSEGLLISAGSTYNKKEIIMITTTLLTLTCILFAEINKKFKLGMNSEIGEVDDDIVKYSLEITKYL